MPPSDKNKSTENSINGEGQAQGCSKPQTMDSSLKSESSSMSDVTIPGHGMITNIPLITASVSTLKCSINDQMKTFDPGENGGIERLMSNHCGKSSLQGLNSSSSSSGSNNNTSSLNKSSTKNYKAGSKINKLADMLAKRSQNIVEVTQNSTSNIISDITSVPKVEDSVILNNVSNIINFDESLNRPVTCFKKTAYDKELNVFRKSRRKSVPNQSCNVQRLQPQSTSKSCSDFSKLFPVEEENGKPEFDALGGSLIKLQTDESTKKKVIRKNLRNVESPLILPERKKASVRNENLVSSIVIEKILNVPSEAAEKTNIKIDNCEETNRKIESPEETNRKIESPEETNRKIESPEETNRKIESPEETNRKIESPEETNRKIESPEEKNRKIESPEETNRKIESPEETNKKIESPEETNRNIESSEETNKNMESSEETLPSSKVNPVLSVSGTKLRKVRQSKSKKLVETSTQTADIGFMSVFKQNSKCEVTVEKPSSDEKTATEESVKTYECLYCTQTFALGSECKTHEKIHTQKNNKQFIKCQYCSKKLLSLNELKSHCVQKHPNKYSYCMKCDERFSTKEGLYSHNKEIHLSNRSGNLSQHSVGEEMAVTQEKTKPDVEEKQIDKKISKQSVAKTDLKVDVSYDSLKKSSVSPRNVQKSSPKENKSEEQLLEMEMLFYSHLSGNIQENLTNHLDGKIDKSGNPIRTDKITEKTDALQTKTKSSNLLSVVIPSAGVPDIQIARAPSPYQTRSKTPNPLPTTAKKFKKLPNWQQKFWEKYNFPTNYRYEHRFWDKNYFNTEKSPLYLKDLSCLDIKTQITMRENIKKLDTIKKIEETLKSVNKLKFPDYLSLVPRVSNDVVQENKLDVNKSNSDQTKNKKQIRKEETKKSFKPLGPETSSVKTRGKLNSDMSLAKKQLTEGSKMMTRRQSSIDLTKENKEDSVKKRKGSLDMGFNQRMTLRRQSSVDNIQGSGESKAEKNDQILEVNLNSVDVEKMPLSPTGSAEISGEWVRPRSYLCGTCCTKFTNLWELEDHKWVSHPNVWCTHYEFEDEKIDKLFEKSEEEAENSSESSTSKLKLTDLYKRYLLPHGSLKTAKLVPNTNFPEQCTKCKKNCMNSSEMHKHMLDCGGDTTWFLTMYSSPMTIKRKWRPFGSRRKKQIARRDLKRNIPSTPTLRSYHYQQRIRTKPGDVETIQKMLANLPEKRARRAINFDEIKTRSQATIHSNRLLRKRFKSTFASNFLKLKNLKQKRQLKQGKKEGSSKSSTDTSSENTPVASPKRKNKLKENMQLVKEENSAERLNESLVQVEVKSGKKKNQSKKKESPTVLTELNKPKIKTEKQEIKKEKPMTRRNGCVTETVVEKPKRKTSVVKEEVLDSSLDESKTIEVVQSDVNKEKDVSKTVKKAKRKITNFEEVIIKEECSDNVIEIIPKTSHNEVKETITKSGKKFKPAPEESNKIEGGKKKRQLFVAPGSSLLQLKQKKKNNTEMLKRMKKKIKNSKKNLKLKEMKSMLGGSRRSPRIKSLQRSEDCLDFVDNPLPIKKEEYVGHIDLKTKKTVVNLENINVKKVAKVTIKNQKSNDAIGDSNQSENINLEENLGRRSSRLLRNSLSYEEKSDMLVSDECSPVEDNSKKVSTLRRNSRSLSDTADSTQSEAVEGLPVSKKSSRIQSIRLSRNSEENSDSVLPNGQISLLKKNRLQNHKSSRGVVKAEVLEPKKLDLQKNSDLTEMPILAKVEPIRGKSSSKKEKEIPVLLPVEKEQCENSEEESPSFEEDSISFQVIKNRRKTSKEVTPLKIVKKVESVSLSSEKDEVKCLQKDRNDGTGLDDLETGKSKRKRFTIQPPDRLPEKKSKTDVKKYFLGICPSEIDKGRKEIQDESGSDSEPLITLVVNQSHKGNKSKELIVKQEEIFVTEEEEIEKQNPSKQVKKKNIGELEETATTSQDLLHCVLTSDEKEDKINETAGDILVEKLNITNNIKRHKKLKKKKLSKKNNNELRMTVTLKEPTLKIVDKQVIVPSENKWTLKTVDQEQKVETTAEPPPSLQSNISPEVSKESFIPERRSRRISKETKPSKEFIIDDPLILVDELWSDLDSDSDSTKKKTKKGKKKSPKKKTNDEKRISDVNLEELLRNFGEKKDPSLKKNEKPPSVRVKLVKGPRCWKDARKAIENRKKEKSYRRLSLKLFQFNKLVQNFGNQGERLADAKRALQKKQEEIQAKAIPDLPFLTAEIKENPVQVIQCRARKAKTVKIGPKKVESKSQNNNMHLKISLPLENINNATVFNNNNVTELVVEDALPGAVVPQDTSQPNLNSDLTSQVEELPLKDIQTNQDEAFICSEPLEATDLKNKSKRSEVIDKIFYCEICKTYYYSSSQLKNHKLSNRHKLKESELLLAQQAPEMIEIINEKEIKNVTPDEPVPVVENILQEPIEVHNIETERLNDDTLEMPILEGPFIENPLARLGMEVVEPTPQPPVVNSFGFSQESLKDIQRAIGCTDEEMFILTLLGENTIELENEILDLDLYKAEQSKIEVNQTEKVEVASVKENEKANGASFKLDLKQRMTSALTCLVNKAVFNLLQKYETAAKSAVNPEALSLLGKLSSLSRRKNILQLNELLKKQNDGETSFDPFAKDSLKKEPPVSYKYQCTICGSRFEKASTRDCHISRSHKGKSKKQAEDTSTTHTPMDDDWNDTWSYDASDDHLGSTNTSQFWCSDCGINFVSPQEVLEHQKLEHQAGMKNLETTKDASPLQSATIGSSDEIIEGKKTKKRPKVFSSEDLDQQRIIANNELRKLDRKFSIKNKASKVKWGMDALRFTVEKENKLVMVEEEKEVTLEEAEKPPVDVKNIDLVPKLNLSRTGSIPEFKVIQKTSFKNRFQKIIDNKLKRKSHSTQQEGEIDEVETEVMLVPVVVKKKSKKQKINKYVLKKDEEEKPLDVYDFNESESEGEPVVFSHVKKQTTTTTTTKLKLVKVKESPSKNKADSTTKDLAPDDYDSEDSLPLSVVKKFKPGEDDEDKYEKISEEGVEKSDGILEQVEFLIEQLENETESSSKKSENKENKSDDLPVKNSTSKCSSEVLKTDSIDSSHGSLRVSVANKFLELENLPSKNPKIYKNIDENLDGLLDDERTEDAPEQETTLAEPESSQSAFDEEDSMPLVFMSKKPGESKPNEVEKKCDENTTDVSTTASEDAQLFTAEEQKSSDISTSPNTPQATIEESLPPVFSSSENEGAFSEKSNKPFETVNGNVIYCRNESMSDFGSDLSNDGLIDSNFDKSSIRDENIIKEVTEKEDVVIVCSKGDVDVSNEDKANKRKLKSGQRKKKDNLGSLRKKKKRFPLLSATLEENNFRKSESPLNKEVIVRKIWNRRKLTEESTDNDEDSYTSLDRESSMGRFPNEESQTEVEKEIIVKKIWSRKKVDFEDEGIEKADEKVEDVKINQTEVSNEVVIKCGPKTRTSPKRRKSRNCSSESSKETIMRKIWSGKCTFQTKAALKIYDSDMIPNCKENDISEDLTKPKRRGRPAGFSSNKRSKVESEIDKDDEDDLDSLLEEIEREQLEKAIRLEFLQLRRSDKASVEMKEGSNPTVGLFAESSIRHKKQTSEKKRRQVRRKVKHPRQSVLKRKKLIKRPVRRVRPTEEKNFCENTNRTNSDLAMELSENSLDKNKETFGMEPKNKNRKHKKHRHKHHHHKHKHKKSKHHKCLVGKHKSKHKSDEGIAVPEATDSFTILEKICQDIPNQIENEMYFKSRSSKKRTNSETNNMESKIDDILPPFSYDNKSKDCDELGYDEDRLSQKERFENGNIYEFVDDSDFVPNNLRNLKM